MIVWQIEDAGEPVHFTCASCAIKFYNADRDTRTAPSESEPKDGVKVINCEVDQ